jgi:hypothetical protein
MTDYTTKFKLYKYENKKEFKRFFVEHPSYPHGDEIFRSKSEPNYIIPYPKDVIGDIFPVNFLSYQRSADDSDRLNFFIRRFYKQNNNRTFVIMYCNDRKTGAFERFEYYTSISDGSYWRFCIKSDGEERFDKGYSYVSSTFINIQVQNFIFKFMKLFNIPLSTTPNTILCQLTSSLNSILRTRIINSTYVSGNDFFILLNEIFPPVNYLLDFKGCLSRLLAKLSELTNRNSESDIVTINILSKIYCSLTSNGLNKDIRLSDEISRRTFFTNIGRVFSELFTHYFTINTGTKKILSIRQFNIGIEIFTSAICCVEIEYKMIRGKRYLMYYMIYKSDVSGRSKTILHIIPKDNDVNVYGLDNRYVAAGALINKIFDYKPQAPITVFTRHAEKKTLEYRYIGDLVNYNFLPDFTVEQLRAAVKFYLY